jgi:protein TonB
MKHEIKEAVQAPPRRRPPPAAKIKPQALTAPKLLTKPEIHASPPAPAEAVLEPEQPVKEDTPQIAALRDTIGSTSAGWNVGNETHEAEGTAAGTGGLFGTGDVGVVSGAGAEGGGGGRGSAGLGRGAKGEGTGGGGPGRGEAAAGMARPLGGYQVKPRYPESARRAGAHGVTLLKLLVLDSGTVGEIVIEKSAGHRDLDNAAADAVKKWRFEPARVGNKPVAVWVLLPIKFELN